MKKKQLTLDCDNHKIKVTVEGTFKKGMLTKDEQNEVMSKIADEMVPVLSRAPYTQCYNYQVKVK